MEKRVEWQWKWQWNNASVRLLRVVMNCRLASESEFLFLASCAFCRPNGIWSLTGNSIARACLGKNLVNCPLFATDFMDHVTNIFNKSFYLIVSIFYSFPFLSQSSSSALKCQYLYGASARQHQPGLSHGRHSSALDWVVPKWQTTTGERGKTSHYQTKTVSAPSSMNHMFSKQYLLQQHSAKCHWQLEEEGGNLISAFKPLTRH